MLAGKNCSVNFNSLILIDKNQCRLFSSQVPALVQVQEQWQKFYLGTYFGRGTLSHLDMVHLKKTPPYCKHLTGK